MFNIHDAGLVRKGEKISLKVAVLLTPPPDAMDLRRSRREKNARKVRSNLYHYFCSGFRQAYVCRSHNFSLVANGHRAAY